ncbi:thiol-disulfide oxidoreductase DCC family protein [Metabacillus litoralis]|uniref:thiol-disulfide oxidoreductase DCC family protein n=1 Tax=Metabacillus litoralis TaxID=152268 RepID=UPI000EF5C855|nr:thiol-disulfide oxidoreductase DCC family protein [Metabacillus litoralis]
MNANNQPVLLFDGVCHFCDQAVQFIIRYDKKATFQFAALQSNTGQELLKKFQLPTTNFNSLVVIKGSSYYTKSSAVLEICKLLGGTWQLLYLFKIVPRPIRDQIYNFIARNRYKWFGKKDQCTIPKPEDRKRFLP